MRLKKLSFMLITSGCLVSSVSWGAQIFPEPPNTINFTPRIELTGGLQHDSELSFGLGSAQILMPFTEGVDSASLWYGHLQAYTHASNCKQKFLESSVGIGSGYRFQLNSGLQVGGYGLIDIRLGASKNKYLLFTPGLEARQTYWRLTLNGVLPIGTSHYTEEKFAHQLDDETHHRFAQHQEFDHYHQRNESAPMGIDLNGSLWLNEQLSVSLGGYYIQYTDETTPGVRAGISYAPTPMLRLELQGQYGKTFNISAQFSISLGDFTFSDTRSDRLQAPIFRPMMPINTSSYVDQGEKMVKDQVYFYQSGGSGSECTFENPGGNLKQADIDKMPAGASIYLAEGSDYNRTSGISAKIRALRSFVPKRLLGGSNQDSLVLENKSLFGRSQDFKELPSEAKLPKLHAPLKIMGAATQDHPMRIEHVRLINQPENSNPSNHWESGILVSNATHVQIQNIELGGDDKVDSEKINHGFRIENSQHVMFSDSKIDAGAIMIMMEGAENIQVKKNRFHSFIEQPSSLQTKGASLIVSGGDGIEIEDNTFIIHSNLSEVGIHVNSSPIQLKVQNNRFEFNQTPVETSDFNATILGIEGNQEDIQGIKDNTFVLKAINTGSIKAMKSEDKTLKDGEMTIDSLGNAFTHILVSEPSSTSDAEENASSSDNLPSTEEVEVPLVTDTSKEEKATELSPKRIIPLLVGLFLWSQSQ